MIELPGHPGSGIRGDPGMLKREYAWGALKQGFALEKKLGINSRMMSAKSSRVNLALASTVNNSSVGGYMGMTKETAGFIQALINGNGP